VLIFYLSFVRVVIVYPLNGIFVKSEFEIYWSKFIVKLNI